LQEAEQEQANIVQEVLQDLAVEEVHMEEMKVINHNLMLLQDPQIQEVEQAEDLIFKMVAQELYY
jgi:hypothetical protein